MLEEKLELARAGRAFWIDLVRKYDISANTIVYLMPHQGSSINTCAMRYAGKLLDLRNAQKLLVCVSGQEDFNMVQRLMPKNCEGTLCTISEANMTALMQYYSMYPFSTQVYVVSFSYGADNNIDRLIGYQGISEEELVYIGVLGLPEYRGGEIFEQE